MEPLTAGLLVGGSTLGGLLGSRATRKAAQESAAATRYAADLQNQQFQQTRADQEPWRQVGLRALPGLEGYQAASMEDWQQDPGYQFRLGEGMRALEASKAARGSMGTGNTLRALLDYGQNAASSEYGNVWNRRQAENNQGWNRLASLAGIGQTATQQVGNAGANYANNVGNLMMQNAATQGDAAMAGANVWGGTLRDLAGIGGRYLAQNPVGSNNVADYWGTTGFSYGGY